MELAQAKAIISGGASGLGLAAARRIVSAGGRVALLDVQAEAGAAAVVALGESARFFRCDVSSEAAVNEAVRSAADWLGGLTLAISCAGVPGAGKLLGRDGPMATDSFTRVVGINLVGTLNVDKAAAALMQHNAPNADGERGVLIHTSSVAGYEGQIGQVAYSATKAAVIGMVLPIARELARYGIRVMAIAPGLFETPMLAGLTPEMQAALGAQVPFPSRFGRPAEFAELVASIYGNAMLNGETIRLDGAIRLPPK